ncbi:MAG: hypothetical protein ACRDLK_03475 [Gaiellaceae bacterium]
MTDRGDQGASVERLVDLEAKLEALRRVNAELGRELRRGTVSRQPRSPAVAARTLAKLTNERDTLQAELERTKAELERLSAELAGTRTSLKTAEQGVAYRTEQLEGLRLETERLRHEAFRLRSGAAGLLRRLRARLLRR